MVWYRRVWVPPSLVADSELQNSEEEEEVEEENMGRLLGSPSRRAPWSSS